MKIHRLFNGSRAALAILIMASITFWGCQPDECEDVACQNGSCMEGTCACETGYEGELCQTESRARFLGEWEVGDICRGNAFVYEAMIERGDGADALTIDNLNNQNIPVSATVSGTDISLPEQAFGLAVISGIGGIDSTARVISLEYRIAEDGVPDEVCQATFRLP